MTFPLYYFLILYLIFLVVFLVFYIMVIFHIHISASYTMVSFFMTFLVGILALLTMYSTWYLTRATNWRQDIQLMDTTNFHQTEPAKLENMAEPELEEF